LGNDAKLKDPYLKTEKRGGDLKTAQRFSVIFSIILDAILSWLNLGSSVLSTPTNPAAIKFQQLA